MNDETIFIELFKVALKAEKLGYAVMIFNPESIKSLTDNESNINYSHIINSMHEDNIGLLVGTDNL